jgi:hypothetical protein
MVWPPLTEKNTTCIINNCNIKLKILFYKIAGSSYKISHSNARKIIER